MNAVQKYKIKFLNLREDGTITKTAKSLIKNPTIYFIAQIKDLETIDSILNEVKNTIAGNQIEDETISLENEVAIITNKGIAFLDETFENIIYPLFPLLEFKELCEAWKKILNKTPYHGSKISVWL